MGPSLMVVGVLVIGSLESRFEDFELERGTRDLLVAIFTPSATPSAAG